MNEVTKRQFELGAMESKQWCGEIDEEMGGREEEGRKEGRKEGREGRRGERLGRENYVFSRGRDSTN